MCSATRKLLLNRREIEKLVKETMQKGMTLVVTRIYWKNGRIKFEIGVAKGKKLYDKRETEMRKTIKKETDSRVETTLCVKFKIECFNSVKSSI